MKRKSFLISILTIVTLSNLIAPSSAIAEECRSFDLLKTFAFGYTPDFPTWVAPGERRVIKWAALEPGDSLNGKAIQQSFGSRIEWLQSAFQSWDDAVESITFLQVKPTESPEIKVGYTNILELDRVSLFRVWPDTTSSSRSNIRTRATIEFKYDAAFLIPKDNFLQSAQFEISQVLGMGYLNPSQDYVSVAEYPWQAPYSQIPLGEFDVALIRSLYGESTCPSTFPLILRINLELVNTKNELISRNREIESLKETLVKTEADLDLANSDVFQQFKQIEDLTNENIELKKKTARYEARLTTTITCVSGKKSTKVTGIDPVCPKGYKKK